ncbi:hypothetical protein GDO81_021923 [Engystomops pustulosus]|uniref:Uncharacterized protein n=1 Tax=Engystomops pustulosus TaxID=76066 RepID=A0AAV6ZRK5_ENGPU|nr:hypothetical protein GDO81_021923 [Engystomops pustulosus]
MDKNRPLHHQSDLYLCAAYIAPPESPYFNPDCFRIPDVAHFQALGQVLIYGDLNARTEREKDFRTTNGNIYIFGAETGYSSPIHRDRNSYDGTVKRSGRKLCNIC